MSRKPKETAPPRAFPVAKSKPAVKTAPATKAIAAPIEEPVVVEPAPVEEAVAESNKLTDASIKLTEQTLAPITARVTVAVETFGKAA